MARQGSTEDDDGDDALVEVVEVELGDVLDLHTFAPRDVKALVTDYLELAAKGGYAEVRIIHGKGTGTLRRLVHSVLEKHTRVAGFRLAGDASGWGATVVTLRRGG
jgi:dsDNA-specific endonuclease/ATPase MutS2